MEQLSTRVFYLPPGQSVRELKVLDLTSELSGDYKSSFTPEFKETANHLVRGSPPPNIILTSTKWYRNSSKAVTDNHGTHLADWHSPLWSHGFTSITFPEGSPHCEHNIEVAPTNIHHRSQRFVKDSASYVWESAGKLSSGTLILCRESTSSKTPVARYESDNGRFQRGGCW
ncbi:hypothetical protein N7510_006392 [Penicillium lagena]|uniref:uncharacterized protein n=1 Tax=Penicillium lagena TaxID=94218 RepID=UPI002541E561|nr:uncharacterized protein N7510_006392 [Penicillium lagena]KAJ5613198.1 hypothetical protein N7510_006392 [Penicillium lagena]